MAAPLRNSFRCLSKQYFSIHRRHLLETIHPNFGISSVGHRNEHSKTPSSVSGLEKATAMFDKVQTEISPELESKNTQAERRKTDFRFETLLKNSLLMQLGDPNGRIVIGSIFDIVGEDLYIDFGCKFLCVCRIPSNRGYHKNKYVHTYFMIE